MTPVDPAESLASISITADHGGVAAGSITNVNGSFTNFNYHAPENRRSAAVVQLLTAGSVEVDLVGRDDELAKLTHLLQQPATGNVRAGVPVVTGHPGVGKSELVRHIGLAMLQSGWFTHVPFVDLHGYDPDPDVRVGPESVYASVLVLLGLSRSDLPNNVAELASTYHQHLAHLAKTGRRVLLVLDNVGDVSQIAPLLPADSAHRLIVTSRETLAAVPQARIVDVGVLSPASAMRLVRDAVDARVPGDTRLDATDVAEELVALCGHLPLALHIVAALLADEPTRPATELVAEFRVETTRLSGLDYDRDWSVRAAFELSYRRLDNDLAELFRLLPAVPGVDTGLVAVAALTQESETAVRRKLMRLVRAHLVERPVNDRWHMHDLIRLYAQELSELDPQATDAAFRRAGFELLLRFFGAGAWLRGESVPQDLLRLIPPVADAMAWFDLERQTIVALVERMADHQDFRDGIADYAYPICVIFERLRFIDEWIAVAAAWTRATVDSDDRAAEAAALNNLAVGLRNAQRYEDSLEIASRALLIYRARGDRAGQCAALNESATALQDLLRFEEAIELYRADIEICQESGDLAAEASASNNLGAAYINAGCPDEAVPAIKRAAELFAQVGNQLGEAQALNNAGVVLSSAGKWTEAAFLFRSAASAFLRLGDRYTEIGALNNLGFATIMEGRSDEAVEILQGARERARQMNDRHLEAKVLTNIGLAHLCAGRVDDAISTYVESSAVAAEIGDQGLEGRAQHLLADALLTALRPGEARAALRRAVSLLEQTGAPGAARAREQLRDLEADNND
ncbi:tetratricopeptide repeat protein [Nocardia sp. 2YAB30]|uniref:tetratricopeptide repeat protein n=1 Tax=unclassified Nocardia TaxID=2637762 RepID=UPI003F9B701D